MIMFNILNRPPLSISSIHHHLSLISRRHRSLSLPEVQLVEAYLKYCTVRDINLESTVFKGTLYELQCKEFLHQHLNCFHLIRVGGCYDNGVDILGKWNLRKYYDLLGKPTAKRTSVLYYQNDLDQINILVQCKNIGTKINARVVREMAGIYEFNVTRTAKQLRTNYMFLFSPHLLSPQALIQFNTTKVPMIHIQMRATRMGTMKIYGMVMNPTARKSLEGLQLERELERVAKTLEQ